MQFEEYWSTEKVSEGLKRGTLIEVSFLQLQHLETIPKSCTFVFKLFRDNNNFENFCFFPY